MQRLILPSMKKKRAVKKEVRDVVQPSQSSVMFQEQVGHGECDWCRTYAPLVKKELPEDDEVHICTVCWWLDTLKAEAKAAKGVGEDLA